MCLFPMFRWDFPGLDEDDNYAWNFFVVMCGCSFGKYPVAVNDPNICKLLFYLNVHITTQRRGTGFSSGCTCDD